MSTMPIAMISVVLVALAGSIDGAAAQTRQHFETTGKLLRVGTGLEADGLFLTLDVNTTNNTCTNKSGLFMDRANPQYRETVSIALLSLAQARPIDVYYYGDCYGQLVKLYAVAIHTGP
jgi:hypothetical protein